MNDCKQTILFYIDSMYRGGANRVIANLANYFAKKESFHIVLVNDIRGTESEEYPIEERVQRYILNEDKKKRSLIRKTFLRIKKLRSVIKLTNPTAIVSFMGPPNIRMLISSIGIKARKIVSVRNDPYVEYGKGLKKLLANCIFSLANGVVFQTEQASLYFWAAIRRKARTIFNPVDDVFFNQDSKEEKQEIVFVGRLQKQKNPLLLLRSFIDIKDDFPSVRLLYYGDGELKTGLLQKVNESNISDRVFFMGQTSEIAGKISSASCFVLCSDYEGMPNALMEAMAIGIPVISTDCPCGGPRALIENDQQGVLVKCGDSGMLSTAMRKILASSQIRESMRSAEKKRALAFRPDIVFKLWELFILNTENNG